MKPCTIILQRAKVTPYAYFWSYHKAVSKTQHRVKWIMFESPLDLLSFKTISALKLSEFSPLLSLVTSVTWIHSLSAHFLGAFQCTVLSSCVYSSTCVNLPTHPSVSQTVVWCLGWAECHPGPRGGKEGPGSRWKHRYSRSGSVRHPEVLGTCARKRGGGFLEVHWKS